MNKEIVLVELFSGIGGFAKGLSDSGFVLKHHLFSEINVHAIANYKYNFPDAEYIGSVTDVSGTNIRERFPNDTIIVTFGFPCQDNSIAGKRKGTVRGTRSGLLFEAGRICLESKCQIFIAENVKGLYSVNDGEDFQEALRFLTFLDTDSPQYTVEQQLLNTSWLLPQNRERTYFIGHIGTRGIKRIFPITENDCRATEGTGETSTVRTLTGGGGNSLTKKHCWDMIKVMQVNENESETGWVQQQKRIYDSRGLEPTLSKSESANNPIVLINSATKDGYESAKEGDSINYSMPNSKTRPGRVGVGVGVGVAQTLDTQVNQSVIVSSRGRGYNNEQTLEPNTTNTLTGVTKDNMLLQGFQIRRLTEVECERLQGFPDNFTKFGNYDGVVKQISKTQRYKLCGNAVTRDIIELIGKKLLL